MMAEHGKPCEVQDANYCMNGGTCYKLSSVNTLSCVCSEKYIGSRCEQLHLDFSHSLDSMDTGLLAAVIIVAILIIVVLAVIIYYVHKMLKNKQKQQDKPKRYWEVTSKRV